MKRFGSVFLALALFSCSFICVSAVSEATISGENKSIAKGDEVIVPVSIDNNNGIMGFKITVDYDPTKIGITALTAGGITSSGNFISNVGDKKGHIDVVWSHHEDVTGAGVLFSITVKALQELYKTTEIKIGYSKNDTFNSEWHDVKLNCKNIIISGGSAPEKKTSTEKSTENQTVTDNQIINAVQEALDDMGYDSIDDVKDTDEFVNKVNEKIKENTGVDSYKNKDYKSLKEDYNNKRSKSIKKNLLGNVDAVKVKGAINDALNKARAATVKDVKDKEKFVKDVQSDLSDDYPDANNIYDELGNDEAFKLIDKIYDEVKDTPSNEYILIIIIIVVGIVFAAIIVLLMIKKKGKIWSVKES